MRLLDGGTATEISRNGYEINSDPLWSARYLQTMPSVIKDVHKSFISAGAELVVTASYQASIPHLQKHLGVSEDDAIGLIKLSVKLAQEARAELNIDASEVLVAGSVGPYGATLCDGSEYNGHYVDKMGSEELTMWHTPRIKALVEAGADVLAIETIPALKEAQAVLKALTDFPDTKAYVTFSCKDGELTCYGDKFGDAVLAVTSDPHVVAVGMNCTHPQHVSSLLRQIAKLSKDIIVKPNSGEDWEQGHWSGAREEESPFAKYVSDWLSLGATWIGGCCRIFPQDIAALKQIVADYSNS